MNANRVLLRRSALTLVELLISIAIISILAAILLGAASVAGETAREARTKALIGRLHTLLMERYDSYRNVRVEVKPAGETDSNDLRTELTTQGGFDTTSLAAVPDPRPIAMARVYAVRELMKKELPDRWSDIVGGSNIDDLDEDVDLPSVPLLIGTASVASEVRMLKDIPSLTKVYHRAYEKMADSGVTAGQARENQGAECLYLIVMNATGDGEARGLFSEADIADTDEDGSPEFVDGWGNPISFLRWAPGFDSDVQQSVSSLIRTEQDGQSVQEAIQQDHDPYDLFRVDSPELAAFNAAGGYVGGRAWRLVPLILSAGGDEETGIREGNGASGDPRWTATVDPYADVDPTAGHQALGEVLSFDDETYADNLHNHSTATLAQSR